MAGNTKKEYTKRHYSEFVMPILMSLGANDKAGNKRINEIESDVCEILGISGEEKYTYYDTMPDIRILRSKLEWALYAMRKDDLIKAVGLGTYNVTDKGRKALFN